VRSLDTWLKLDRCNEELAGRGRLASQIAQQSEIPDGLVAVVEDVRSLWNVGSIFRTADGAGFSHIILCGITGTPPRKQIAKTSLGAEDSVSWSYARSVAELVEIFGPDRNFLLGLEYTTGKAGLADSILLSKALQNQLIKMPVYLVVGNEVTGLSPEALTASRLVCHLPMRGVKESLNVSVAFGIASYMLAEHF
jgi:23S rRNA (guanosine2251-2'-O)-methyltransferase